MFNKTFPISRITISQASKKSNKKADKLYHVEVIEGDGKMKVHYTGYSSDFDEWKFNPFMVKFSQRIKKYTTVITYYFYPGTLKA